MTELQQRAISGAVLLALALGAVVVGGDTFFTLLAILCLACLAEGYNLMTRWPGRIGFGAYILFGFAAAYSFREYFGLYPFLIMGTTVFLTDLGAYLTGPRIGGPKIAPAISPNKTWSGAVGGLVLPLLFVVALRFIFPPLFVHSSELPVHMSLPSVLITTVLVSTAAQAGDLFESWLKRRAGVKDSGNFIPGHGGFLDRFDSWIAAFVVNGLIHAIVVWF